MAYKQSYLKSQHIEPSSLGILNTSKNSDNDDQPLSNFKLGHNQDDSTDDMELFALMQQFYTVRTDVDSLTLDDYLPAAEIKDLGWAPPESISDLSDLIRDLENIELGKGLLANSRLSMVIMNGKDKGKGGRRPGSIAVSPEIANQLELANDKLKNVNLKKLTTKIYFNTENDFETVTLTSFSNPKLIIEGFIQNKRLERGTEYVLMEVHSNFLVERSIKCWEPVLPIISNWAPESHSALLIRRKQFEIPMNSVPTLSPIFSSMVQYQVKKNKWEKRFVIIKKGNVYFAKNEGLTNLNLLCSLVHFDIFSLTQPKKKSPSPHVVALKSQQPVHMFEKPEEDFIHFLAFDKPNAKDMFTRSLAYARSWQMYQNYLNKPDPLSPFADPSMLSDQIAGLDFDQGQFSEVENGVKSGGGNNGLTKNTVGGIAERFFRLVLTGDQGKTDIDKVVGAKALPDVFAQGSLLSKNESTKPASSPSKEEAELEEEAKDTYKTGSLLSKKLSFKKNSVAKGNDVEPPAGSLLAKASSLLGRKQADSTTNGSNNSTLLNNVGNPLNRNMKPNPIATIPNNNGPTAQSARSGPLLQVKTKDEGLFNNNSLLSQPVPKPARKLSVPNNVPAPANFTNSNDSDLPLSYRMRPNNNLKSGSTSSTQSYSPTSSNSPSPRAPNLSTFTPTAYEPNRPLPPKQFEAPPPLIRKPSLLNPAPVSGPLTNIKDPKVNEQRYKKGSLLDNPNGVNPTNDLNKGKPNGILPAGRPTLLTQSKSVKYTNSSAIPTSKGQGPLISLDDSRYKRHTDQVKDKHFKPLLSFK